MWVIQKWDLYKKLWPNPTFENPLKNPTFYFVEAGKDFR